MLFPYIWGPNVAITVSADGLAPSGARSSAGRMMTLEYEVIIFFEVLLTFNAFKYILFDHVTWATQKIGYVYPLYFWS